MAEICKQRLDSVSKNKLLHDWKKRSFLPQKVRPQDYIPVCDFLPAKLCDVLLAKKAGSSDVLFRRRKASVVLKVRVIGIVKDFVKLSAYC